jgi:hypothetical protein
VERKLTRLRENKEVNRNKIEAPSKQDNQKQSSTPSGPKKVQLVAVTDHRAKMRLQKFHVNFIKKKTATLCTQI